MIDRYGRLLHSFAELVVNNFLNLNGVNNLSQHVIEGLQTTAKLRRSDFYLPEANVVIEVSQTTNLARGLENHAT